MDDLVGYIDKELLQVDGVVERIVYQNDDNYYTVCELLYNDEEFIVLVGNMPYLAEGETIHALGRWVVHPSFGRQFRVEYFEKQLPTTSTTILKYLSSGAIKGIGPITAKRIVGQYGIDTFEVIENHPEWLADIPGISEKKAREIGENYRAQFGVRTVMMFCSEFFGPSMSVRIYNKWGTSAVDIIKNEPFRLCDEIYGVGFEKADKIASSFNVQKDDPQRIRSGIKYILSNNAQSNGHCYIPYTRLIEAGAQVLGIEPEQVEKELLFLKETREVTINERAGKHSVYLKKFYDAERYVAAKLIRLQNSGSAFGDSDTDLLIGRIEAERDIKYAKMQVKAIHTALQNGVMILTGGPGTGKTTIICAILRILQDMGSRVALAAPTGRAAKRMSEMTNYEAKTIHRLLEMEFSREREPVFKRNENNLLEEDVIIVDESSMVDVLLMESLLRAIKPGARLILIGDSDQLPSVGAGNVLCDLIDSDIFPTIKLKEIFRQAGESLIITNAHSINDGEYPNLTTKNNDFFFLERNDDLDIPRTIVELCTQRLPRKYGKTINDGIQVITPSHAGAAGTDILNEALHRACNPPDAKKKFKRSHNIDYRVGDKVMQTRNNYDIEWEKGDSQGVGIFNGDIGFITEVDHVREKVIINFDDRIAEYDYLMLEDIRHAYAITIHKSQGSEYPIVIIPAFDYSRRLLTRNLLYTAVTRARDIVIIVGRKDVVYNMVDNNRLTRRYTGLAEMVRILDEEANK